MLVQVAVPELGKFYYMEVRILSEYYKKQESLSLIKVLQFVRNRNLSVSLRYYNLLETGISQSH